MAQDNLNDRRWREYVILACRTSRGTFSEGIMVVVKKVNNVVDQFWEVRMGQCTCRFPSVSSPHQMSQKREDGSVRLNLPLAAIQRVTVAPRLSIVRGANGFAWYWMEAQAWTLATLELFEITEMIRSRNRTRTTKTAKWHTASGWRLRLKSWETLESASDVDETKVGRDSIEIWCSATSVDDELDTASGSRHQRTRGVDHLSVMWITN